MVKHPCYAVCKESRFQTSAFSTFKMTCLCLNGKQPPSFSKVFLFLDKKRKEDMQFCSVRLALKWKCFHLLLDFEAFSTNLKYTHRTKTWKTNETVHYLLRRILSKILNNLLVNMPFLFSVSILFSSVPSYINFF